MKRNSNFFTLVRKHITKIKYIGLILVFFSAIITIRTYINYLAIQETIQNTNLEIQRQNEQIAYTENFLLNYYNSEYKEFFSHHKNKILNRGEKIVQIKILTPEEKQHIKEQEVSGESTEVISPLESWKQFIAEKRAKI